MGSSAIHKLVGESAQGRRIHQTIESVNNAGSDGTIRSFEEREELEARGINPNWSRPKFRVELEKQAKANDVWLGQSYLKDRTLIHDQKMQETSENDVYLNADKQTLTKLNNLSYVKGTDRNNSLNALIDRFAAHNELFPTIPYTIKGFMENKNGFPALVLEQPYIKDIARNANQNEIDNYLSEHGFKKDGIRDWSNGHEVWSNGKYELFDARPANVLKGKDGVLYFIDTIPHSIEYITQNKENKFVNRGWKDVSLDISRNGLTNENIQQIQNHATDIEHGQATYTRFTKAEVQGLTRGGELHVAASIIAGRSVGARETQDRRADRQEAEVESYAQKIGKWHDDTEAHLTEKYGEPINSGNESLVYYDSGKVVKTSNIGQYRDLEDALDSITLNNADFPEAKIKVLGFGKDAEGDFQIITEQPYIHEGERKATQEEITQAMAERGYKPNEKWGLRGRYKKDGVLLSDLTPKNVIRTPDGRIVPIDTIMHLNTPIWEEGGNRKSSNEIMPKTFTDKLRNWADRIEKDSKGNLNATFFPFLTPQNTAKALRIVAHWIDKGADMAEAIKRGLAHVELIIGRKLTEAQERQFTKGITEELEKANAEHESARDAQASAEASAAQQGVGVSHEHLNSMAERIGLKPVPRGAVLSPAEYANRGRRLLSEGADPHEFIHADQPLDDRISVARAYLERLSKRVDGIAKKDSKAYEEAYREMEDYTHFMPAALCTNLCAGTIS
jgi:hypothetical protein